METQEVRRLHIVYFLSRKGRIEHPHLIRVHHLSRNGVRLRDVKRWLSELRGNEIPESFSWSYKRRYKTGYVWQDLVDDDLITPISDNEYVLQGSEISSINIKEQKVKEKKQTQPTTEASVEVSSKPASEIEEESPSFGSETSTCTDDSGKVEMQKSTDTTKEEKPSIDDKVGRHWPFYSTLLSKKRSKNATVDEKTAAAEAVELCKDLASEPQCMKSKNNANSKSKMLKNLITCGDVKTNESAVVLMKKPNNKPFTSTCWSDVENVHSAALWKRDSGFGGSQRVCRIPASARQYFSGRRSLDGIEDLKKSKSEPTELKAPCAPYKPVNGPNCSQCGKVFKPEKMHAHMTSCKELKAFSKCAAADNKATNESGDSFSGHLLTLY
ncbi:protein SOSEKI 1-like isoform X2 [Salvia hispanica]|nr:protein SOSEKI 1-like isoform X2 [Salvia hispanica]XP_047947296.1 protein SOSEKI 1-like isoform X2 [Salvia hispanica]